mmetsp:Transcript_11134/g.21875  ORF Transcript_11134/g.21875 Transcript_11134/m.21875 type:complete len:216 (-) Transcript_11134:2518-3165(-)
MGSFDFCLWLLRTLLQELLGQSHSSLAESLKIQSLCLRITHRFDHIFEVVGVERREQEDDIFGSNVPLLAAVKGLEDGPKVECLLFFFDALFHGLKSSTFICQPFLPSFTLLNVSLFQAFGKGEVMELFEIAIIKALLVSPIILLKTNRLQKLIFTDPPVIVLVTVTNDIRYFVVFEPEVQETLAQRKPHFCLVHLSVAHCVEDIECVPKEDALA